MIINIWSLSDIPRNAMDIWDLAQSIHESGRAGHRLLVADHPTYGELAIAIDSDSIPSDDEITRWIEGGNC